MPTFKLEKGSDTYEFDVLGTVKKNGADFGKWSTSKDRNCQVVVVKNGATAVAFDVKWRFVENALCLFSGDRLIHNFQKTANDRPLFVVTETAVLRVRPVQGEEFVFELRGEWDMTSTFDVSFNVNGEISAIDGFIKNDKSLFKYKFSDTRNLYDLTFTGSWVGDVNAQGDIPLKFEFEREDKSKDNFSLPAKARFDRSINQFVYEFDKQNGTERTSIRLVGHVAIGKDSSITYSFESQKEDGVERVRASRFSIAAEMKTEKFEAAVAITYAVKNKNGITTDKTLSIAGKFAFLKGKAPFQLMFVFEMKKSVTDKAVSSQIMFSGTLVLTNLGKVQWKFEQNANVKKLEIEITDIQFKKFKIDSKFNLISDDGNQKKTVRFILGVSF
jgi:hypothetical protein